MYFTYKLGDWVAYVLTDATGKFITASYCEIEKLLKKAAPQIEPLTLTILRIDQDKHKVMNAYLAVMNAEGVHHFDTINIESLTRPIICNETGEIFATLAAAAAKNGGQVCNISSHLNGRKGYRTVKGMTYRYGIDNKR